MQYLVIGRCGMDDIPMKLCKSLSDAYAFAEEVTERKIAQAAWKIMGVDVSIFCNISVLPIDEKGCPRSGQITIFREF